MKLDEALARLKALGNEQESDDSPPRASREAVVRWH